MALGGHENQISSLTKGVSKARSKIRAFSIQNKFKISTKTTLSNISRKAFRRSLENYNGIPFLIFLSNEKFASPAGLDRLPFERYEEKEV